MKQIFTILFLFYTLGISSQNVIITRPKKHQQTTGYVNGYKWVDLGLSVKWATCNIGAETPSDPGNWFHWGGACSNI